VKTEHFFFLVLVLAAAIVVGSTMGILLNMKYITQAVKNNAQIELEQAQQEKQGQTSETDQAVANGNNTKIQSTPNSQQSASTTHSSSVVESDSKAPSVTVAANNSSLMVISRQEQQQIETMLETVDNSQGVDYCSRIKNFQEKNSLSITGILDSPTLNALIYQVKLQKAMQYLN